MTICFRCDTLSCQSVQLVGLSCSSASQQRCTRHPNIMAHQSAETEKRTLDVAVVLSALFDHRDSAFCQHHARRVKSTTEYLNDVEARGVNFGDIPGDMCNRTFMLYLIEKLLHATHQRASTSATHEAEAKADNHVITNCVDVLSSVYDDYINHRIGALLSVAKRVAVNVLDGVQCIRDMDANKHSCHLDQVNSSIGTIVRDLFYKIVVATDVMEWKRDSACIENFCSTSASKAQRNSNHFNLCQNMARFIQVLHTYTVNEASRCAAEAHSIYNISMAFHALPESATQTQVQEKIDLGCRWLRVVRQYRDLAERVDCLDEAFVVVLRAQVVAGYRCDEWDVKMGVYSTRCRELHDRARAIAIALLSTKVTDSVSLEKSMQLCCNMLADC